jgi:diguanylate cyclase (GGDEF)-like protein
MDPHAEFKIGEGLIGWIVERACSIRTGQAEADPRYTPREGQREPMVSFLGAPIVSGSICLGVLSALHPEPDRFTREHEDVLRLIATMCGPFIEERRFAHVTSVDPLTSALSRRGLEMVLPETRISDGGDIPISAIIVDLDRFREVNEEYGGVVGDQVLREVSKLLAGVLGAGDALVRYGGEEFLMVLPGVDASAARHLAENARRVISTTHMIFHDVHIQLTASFGVAERRPHEPRTDLIKRADEALATAKGQGRNRVVLAD